MSIENATVLFVDDEENILKSIRRSLINEPYKKLFASGGEIALKMLATGRVSVLVTDMRMPGINGLDLLKQTQEKYPDVVRIILTGYSQVSTLLSAINSGQVFRYLTKPWKMDTEFIPTIRQAIGYHQIIVERKSMTDKLKAKNMELNTQNLEIHRLMKQVEHSNERKSEIINHLTREILPYVSKVIGFTNQMNQGSPDFDEQKFKDDGLHLEKQGVKITELLKKVESFFQEKE